MHLIWEITDVKGNGKCVKSGKLKINLYLDPVRWSSELVYLDSKIKLQEEDIISRINEQIPCEDDATLKRKLRYFKVQYDPATRLIKSYLLDEKKVEKALKTSGFFCHHHDGSKDGCNRDLQALPSPQ